MEVDKSMDEPEKVITIGGWDPCGAFGVPADFKTFAALNCHGMGVMTVVTAQNSQGWFGAEFMSADFVSQQLDAVLGDYGAKSVKTGFLGRVDLIKTIASKLVEYEIKNIVIDPVIVNVHGRAMFPQEVVDAYFEYLFPLATLVTPNRREFNLLLTNVPEPWAMSPETAETALAFVKQFNQEGDQPAFVVKGLPVSQTAEGQALADGLIFKQKIELFAHPQVNTKNVSGTGDSFSAALCCLLAFGLKIPEAVEKASNLTYQAIKRGADWQLPAGAGPIGHLAYRDSLD